MKAFHKNRLLKLASFLRNLPPAKFDLKVIMETNDEGGMPLEKEKDCGTVGCAMGWCPKVMPKLFAHTYEYYDGDRNKSIYNILLKKNRMVRGFEAVQVEFGLSEKDAEYLFMPGNYHKSKRGLKSVAERIEGFVRRDGKVNHNTKAYEGAYYE